MDPVSQKWLEFINGRELPIFIKYHTLIIILNHKDELKKGGTF